MTPDKARQILYSFLAEKGVSVSPDATAAELVRRAVLEDSLPEELSLALSETFDALASAADPDNTTQT